MNPAADAMKEYLSVIFRSSMARDYMVAAIAFSVLTVFGVHALTGLVNSLRSNVRVQTATIERPPNEVRNYQVSRSVLDDSVVTGSIGGQNSGRPVVLDPCTGQIKSQ